MDVCRRWTVDVSGHQWIVDVDISGRYLLYVDQTPLAPNEL